VDLIRVRVGVVGDEIENLGRVSAELLIALDLRSGDFLRA
jgi:hypothetical protein